MSIRQDQADIAVEKLLASFETFEPLFSEAEWHEGEQTASEAEKARREAFFIGTKSGKQLAEMMQGEVCTQEAVVKMLRAAETTKLRLEAATEIASTCYLRLLVALAYREDADEIVALADAEARKATSNVS